MKYRYDPKKLGRMHSNSNYMKLFDVQKEESEDNDQNHHLGFISNQDES
jgi:hypothetical protein